MCVPGNRKLLSGCRRMRVHARVPWVRLSSTVLLLVTGVLAALYQGCLFRVSMRSRPPVQGNMCTSLRPVKHQERSTGRHSSRRLDHDFPPDMTASGFSCRSRHTRRGTSHIIPSPFTADGPAATLCKLCRMPCIRWAQRLCHTNFVNLNVNGTHAGIPHLVPAR